MPRLTRSAVCAMSLLIASMTVAPIARAETDDDIWDLLGSGVQTKSSLLIMVTPRIQRDADADEHIWDFVGPDGSWNSGDLYFLLDGENSLVFHETDRDLRCAEISEREIWLLIADLEEAGFGFVAEQESEEVIVLFIVY